MRALRILLFLVLAAALVPTGSEWLRQRRAELPLDDTAFFCDLLWEVNKDRDLIGAPDFLADVELQRWASTVVGQATSLSSLRTEEILDRLQEDVPSVATASIFVVYTDSQEALRKRLTEWARDTEGEHTHMATRLFRSPNEPGVGSLAMLVQRLPRFHPGLLGNSSESFYNICPICNESHHGKVNPVARSIVLECPKCEHKYDLLAVDLKGRYHRVTTFLDGESPPAKSPAEATGTKEGLEEVFRIWQKVLAHCRYVKDFTGINGRRDAWQFAAETERYRNGDCEDTAILLADRLIASGFDARVALGRTDRFEGHAWCVVRFENQQFILETTEATPDPLRPPTVERLGGRYIPDFLFDRESIYFREGKKWTGDYWSGREWSKVSYGEEEGGRVAAIPVVE